MEQSPYREAVNRSAGQEITRLSLNSNVHTKYYPGYLKKGLPGYLKKGLPGYLKKGLPGYLKKGLVRPLAR
jgi:hypothetical protein